MSEDVGEELVLASETRKDIAPANLPDERPTRRPLPKVSGTAMDAKQREAVERSHTGAALRRASVHGVRPPAPKKTAEQLARASISASTERAYLSDLRQFARWLAGFEEHQLHNPADIADVKTAPSTPKEVADFLTAKSQSEITPGVRRYTPSIFTRYLAAINWEHRRLGHDRPGDHLGVRDTLKGIRRDDPPRSSVPRP